jgi:hypothetical protein
VRVLGVDAGEPERLAPVASTAADDAAAAVRHGPAVSGVELASLSEWSLAQSCAEQAADSAQRLGARMESLEGRPLAETWPEYEDMLHDFRAAVRVLRWMDHKQMLTLPQPLQDEVRTADGFFEQVFHAPSWEARASAMRSLRAMRLERVRNRFEIKCCLPTDDLYREVGELVIRMPEARSMLPVIQLDDATFAGQIQLGPGQNTYIWRFERRVARPAQPSRHDGEPAREGK